jgi:hypothetical protein
LIAFGKEIVRALELDKSPDVTARWIAHYLAEQLAAVETLTGEQQETAKRECFETILTLWKKRADWPRNSRPLEKFDAVFTALEQLSRKQVVYFQDDSRKPKKKENRNWLELAGDIDHGARALIRWCIANAVEETKGGHDWSDDKVAQELEDGDDMVAARMLTTEQLVVILARGGDSNAAAKELRELRNQLDNLLKRAARMKPALDKALPKSEVTTKRRKRKK